jgi:hypothetical protein
MKEGGRGHPVLTRPVQCRTSCTAKKLGGASIPQLASPTVVPRSVVAPKPLENRYSTPSAAPARSIRAENSWAKLLRRKQNAPLKKDTCVSCYRSGQSLSFANRMCAAGWLDTAANHAAVLPPSGTCRYRTNKAYCAKVARIVKQGAKKVFSRAIALLRASASRHGGASRAASAAHVARWKPRLDTRYQYMSNYIINDQYLIYMCPLINQDAASPPRSVLALAGRRRYHRHIRIGGRSCRFSAARHALANGPPSTSMKGP